MEKTGFTEDICTVITPDGAPPGLNLSTVRDNFELIKALALRAIRLRYRRTKLGILWAFIQPLVYMIVINLFFGLVLRFDTGDVPYPLHLLTGLIAFQLFTKGLNEGATAISGNLGILQKIYIPPMVFPASTIISGLVDFIFPVLLLTGFLLYYQVPPTWNLVYLPLIVLFLLVLFAATEIFMSAVAVRFKDMRMLVQVLSQLMFFGTPIFYSLSIVPNRLLPFFALNPMVGIVEALRWSVLGKPEPPNTIVLVVSGTMIVVVCFAAAATFKKLGYSLHKYL